MKELQNYVGKLSQCYCGMWLKYWYIGLFVVCMVVPGYSQGNAPNMVPNAYIFQVQDDIDPDVAATSMAQMFRGQVRQVYNTGARGFAIHNLPPGLEKKDLEQFAWIKTVSPDLILETNAQEVPTGISRIGADYDFDGTSFFGGTNGVNVAIIDTGIDVDHEDLNVVGGFRTFGKGPAKKWESDFDDDNGHGTHVAGTVAALDNGLGVVGVAPGANLYAVKVLDSSGRGYLSDIIAGIEWVTANANTIDVANMSLGGIGVNEAYHNAIKACVEAGVVMVVSAGNAIRDIYGPDGEFGTNDDIIPAAYPEAMTISALTDTDGSSGGFGQDSTTYAGNDYNGDGYDDGLDDSFTFFSNFSHAIHDTEEEPYPVVSPGKAIDLILPGVDINSTYLDDTYRTMSGTSMSAPHATGLVARYIADTEITSSGSEKVYEIRQALIDNAVAQRNAAEGLTYLNDPDGNEEPIGWAGDPVESNLIPTADFSYTTNGLDVSFTDESSDDSVISSWSWDFGDSSGSSTEQDPTHTYDEEGSYEVTLNVTDDQGSSSSIIKTVVVSTGSLTLHVGDIDGGFQNWGQEMRYGVWVTVHDKFDNIISGATVSGRWIYAGETIEADAISDSEGIAFMDIFVRKKNGNMITFVVDEITHPDYDGYDSNLNHDEDGDSDGTEILINF